MAFLQCDFFSEVLGLSCSMNVILPQTARGQIGMDSVAKSGKHPVLWLLHGSSDDHTIWMRRTSIERYAAAHGLAVVMPAANLSYYRDMLDGPRYGTFIREELPEIARGFFPLSDRREDNFIAGLSMGGYGAFLLALSAPEKFAAAASLSGVLDIAWLHERRDAGWLARAKALFGNPEDVAGSDADLLALATKLVHSGAPPPALYACCGTEDGLLETNRRFSRHAGEIGLPLTYEEHPGEHEWGYWDQQIQRVLEWLPIRARP